MSLLNPFNAGCGPFSFRASSKVNWRNHLRMVSLSIPPSEGDCPRFLPFLRTERYSNPSFLKRKRLFDERKALHEDAARHADVQRVDVGDRDLHVDIGLVKESLADPFAFIAKQ